MEQIGKEKDFFFLYTASAPLFGDLGPECRVQDAGFGVQGPRQEFRFQGWGAAVARRCKLREVRGWREQASGHTANECT